MAAKVDFEAVFDASPNPYIVLDCGLRFVAINAAYLAATGRTREDLIGKHVTEAFADDQDNDSRRMLLDSLARVVATGKPDTIAFVNYRILVRNPDGDAEQSHYWSASNTPLLDGRGEVAYILHHVVDVTHLRQVQRGEAAGVLQRAAFVSERNDELQRVNARLRALFAQAPVAICVLWGPELVVELANARACELMGRDEAEIVDRPLFEVAPHVRDRLAEVLQCVRDTARPAFANELALTLDRGGPVEAWFDVVYQPVVGAGGEVEAILIVASEVTETVLARRQSELSRAELEAIFESVPEPLYAGDTRGVQRANAAARELLGGVSAEELPLAHGPLVEAVEPREADTGVRIPQRDTPFQRALRGESSRIEMTITQRGTRQQRRVMSTAAPIRSGDRLIGAVVAHVDTTERHAAEAEARAARDQAERANALKDQFLAMVSHELRTPLTAILGWAQMMKFGAASPEKQQRAFDVIERNARIQAHLIDDLLDVSRILAGKLVFDMKDVDAASVVAAAVETVRPMAEAKGVGLDVDIESSAAVTGDASRLQQVVWNLLSNAVKFTPGGGRVGLRLERRDGDLEIAVTDTGIGIDPAFLPHVFERFRQAATGTTATGGGLGLGMSIVKHVVEAHHGSVAVSSAGPGRGATFRVRVPLRPEVPGRADEPASWPAPAVLEGMSVLVIDDERDTRDYVRSLLEQSKAHVTVATSAAEGLRRLAEVHPDVVLSDIVMPQEDGYSFVRRMRALAEPAIARTPAIALTAHARAEDRARAMRAGFQNHVAKPIDGGELLAVIATFAPRRLGVDQPPR